MVRSDRHQYKIQLCQPIVLLSLHETASRHLNRLDGRHHRDQGVRPGDTAGGEEVCEVGHVQIL